jgi:glycosyltransferase involved in cell wall biosynthesis
MKICAVVPAYNEEETISGVVEGAKRYCQHVIVVDDGSEDKTFERAREKGAQVLRHPANMGVGFATKTGNDFAVEKGYEVIVNLDSDGQHSASSIPEAVRLLQEEDVDIVIGSRFLKGRKKMPWILKLGNSFLTLANRVMFGSAITDTQSGFRVLTSNAWKTLSIESTGYTICSEIAAKVGMKKLKYAEVPIETIYLDKFKGTTIFDGIKIFSNMVRWLVRKCFSGFR